ncbi:hypothetical protein ARMGADRAFT_1070432 [Armillaria gallica]|uniref:Uncharacterized protein n=1 Tax=Armillaria gallica TaxID=47427 RepID=A0A2H3ECA2_ARMGA|nr:hypothetical protein ARMGADRAFT_1070432 [Armillaria gallica]
MPFKRRTRFIIGGVVIGAIAGASLAPVIGPAVVGLSAAGVVAGGLAAIIQSGIGNVPPGGFFAHLQSMAMGGPIRPEIIVYIIPGAVIGGIVGGLVGWLVHWIVEWFEKRNARVKVVQVKA